jgi:hypothetical protein
MQDEIGQREVGHAGVAARQAAKTQVTSSKREFNDKGSDELRIGGLKGRA